DRRPGLGLHRRHAGSRENRGRERLRCGAPVSVAPRAVHAVCPRDQSAAQALPAGERLYIGRTGAGAQRLDRETRSYVRLSAGASGEIAPVRRRPASRRLRLHGGNDRPLFPEVLRNPLRIAKDGCTGDVAGGAGPLFCNRSNGGDEIASATFTSTSGNLSGIGLSLRLEASLNHGLKLVPASEPLYVRHLSGDARMVRWPKVNKRRKRWPALKPLSTSSKES